MRSYNHYSSDANRSAAQNPSDMVFAIVLAANTAQTITLPAGLKTSLASFTSTVPFYVNFNSTGATQIAAIVPVANNTNGTAPVFNPTVKFLSNQSSISIIAPSAGVVTIEFFNVV